MKQGKMGQDEMEQDQNECSRRLIKGNKILDEPFSLSVSYDLFVYPFSINWADDC